MKKILFFFVAIFAAIFFVTTGCTNKKVEQTADSTTTDSTEVDSTEVIDSVTQVIAETPMPKSADQLFDDFFFNFIANKDLQRKRIKFPLPIESFGKKSNIQKEAWTTERFFRQQGYYTLIFDNEQQAKLAQSTNLDTVIVEKILLKEGTVKQYLFDHQNGIWEMSQIREVYFKDSYNADFLSFLSKFFKANGAGMIKNPLAYKGPDPNGEENNIINMTIPAEEWSTFLPEIPENTIYNILYGQKYAAGNTKILTFRGLANGVETVLIFNKTNNKWQLVKIVAS